MKKIKSFGILSCTLAHFIMAQVSAETIHDCETVQSGIWEVAANWTNCNGLYPGLNSDGDDRTATIKTNHTMTLGLESLALVGFTMESDGELIIDDQFSHVEFIVNPEPFDSSLGRITVNADNFVINAQFNEAVLGAIDGGTHLTVIAKSIIRFNGDIGQVTPLQSLTTPNIGAFSVFDSARTVTLNGTTDSVFENIIMDTGAVVNLNHTGTGQLIFNGLIEKSGTSPQQLSINKDNSEVVFNENVDLGELGVGGSTTTVINSAEMNTDHDMVFDTNVEITEDVLFKINGIQGGLFFNANLDAAANATMSPQVVLSSSERIHLNAVGQTRPLETMTVTGTGLVELNGNIRTSGIQSYQVPIKQNANVTYKSDNDVIDFAEAISTESVNSMVLIMGGSNFELSNLMVSSGINQISIRGSGNSILTADWATTARVRMEQTFNAAGTVSMSSALTRFSQSVNISGGDLILAGGEVRLSSVINRSGNSEKLVFDLLDDNRRIITESQAIFNLPVEVNSGLFQASGQHNADIFVQNTAEFLGLGADINADVFVKNTAQFLGLGVDIDASLIIQNEAVLLLRPALAARTEVDTISFPTGLQKTVVTINGSEPIREYGQITVQDGPINLSGTLETEVATPITMGDQFTIIDNRSANPVGTFFNGLPEGGLTSDGFFTISYAGGDGNDVVLTAACSQSINVFFNGTSGTTALEEGLEDVCAGGVLTLNTNSTETTIDVNNTIVIERSLSLNGNDFTLNGPTTESLFAVNAGQTLSVNRMNIINTSGDGAILNQGTLILSEVYFANNSQTNLSPGGGGAILNLGQASIKDSTFYQNEAERGGAIFNDTAGVMTISNSTFYRNGTIDALQGGAIHNRGDIRLTNTTLVDSGNAATTGNTIFNIGKDAALTIQNTVIEASSPLLECQNTGGATLIELDSFVDDGSCDASLFGDPKLGNWSDQGGHAFSISPLPGSRLIDAGNDDVCPDVDILGTSRPQRFQCDIGAIEFTEAIAPQLNAVTMNELPLMQCQNRMDDVIQKMSVTFSEPMLNTDDVLNYVLVYAGEDLNFEAPFDSDNELLTFNSLSVDDQSLTPTVNLILNETLADGLYRLELASVITDEYANPLYQGNDTMFQFRIDSENFLINGDYDNCDGVEINDRWQYATTAATPNAIAQRGAPGEFISDDQDLLGSEHSGALRIFTFDNNRYYQLTQCQNIPVNLPLNFTALIKLQSVFPTIQSEGGDPDLSEAVIQCDYWDAEDCMGELLNSESENFNEVGSFDTVTSLDHTFNPAPNAALSVSCGLLIRPDTTESFTTLIDGLKLSGQDEIFTNGFEINP